MILAEDDDLLVVNKPAGWNTHAPSEFSGEGVYEWLRHREPRWAELAILHRLDKETSGVLVFGKSSRANRELTRQWTEGRVRKVYRVAVSRSRHRLDGSRPNFGEQIGATEPCTIDPRKISDENIEIAQVDRERWRIRSHILREGDLYRNVSARHGNAAGKEAITEFTFENCDGNIGWGWAYPLTGRTHQIRVHAAAVGWPVLGDKLYGGIPAGRVWLHAERIGFQHPANDEWVEFEANLEVSCFPSVSNDVIPLSMFDFNETNVWRRQHGRGFVGGRAFMDRLGDYLLVQAEESKGTQDLMETKDSMTSPIRGVYFKSWPRDEHGRRIEEASPELVTGVAAPDRFIVRENGLNFLLSLKEGYSNGLFLDQRDNRRRLLTGHVAANFPLNGEPHASWEVLNTFAYTCSFSVAAAYAGAKVTSLDLSRKYLEWGRENFRANLINPEEHAFIYGDCFDWMKRWARKGRQFSVVMLDPPTFSRSRDSGEFKADRDYGKLVSKALPLIRAGGVLFASSNMARWEPEAFLGQVLGAVQRGGRRVISQHYVPQPPDFPVSREEPAYLKTLWLRLD